MVIPLVPKRRATALLRLLSVRYRRGEPARVNERVATGLALSDREPEAHLAPVPGQRPSDVQAMQEALRLAWEVEPRVAEADFPDTGRRALELVDGLTATSHGEDAAS